MSMEIGSAVNAVAASYGAEIKPAEKTKDTGETRAAEPAAVYEKGTGEEGKAAYGKNVRMSDADRAKLVQQLKDDAAMRESQFLDLVQKTLTGQAGANGKATNIWQRLRTGDFVVDEQTRAQAQKDIAEDGYYGVKQTSQRLFDFAKALAGDDPEKMKKLQGAMEKGFKQAEKTWGGQLPQICQDTMDSARKLFDDYMKENGVSA